MISRQRDQNKSMLQFLNKDVESHLNGFIENALTEQYDLEIDNGIMTLFFNKRVIWRISSQLHTDQDKCELLKSKKIDRIRIYDECCYSILLSWEDDQLFLQVIIDVDMSAKLIVPSQVMTKLLEHICI